MLTDTSRLRKGLVISSVTAVVVPLLFGAMLAGASAMGQRGDQTVTVVVAPATPKAPPPHRHLTLSQLGRARAIAFVGGGHMGP